MKFGKILAWTLGGMAIGHIVGRLRGTTEEEKKRFAAQGRIIGGFSGLGISLVKSYEPADTLNYKLKHKNKVVYHGITLEHRRDIRPGEHERAGKLFDTVVFDQPKPASIAKEKEIGLIKRTRPKYNVQHNC